MVQQDVHRNPASGTSLLQVLEDVHVCEGICYYSNYLQYKLKEKQISITFFHVIHVIHSQYN